MYYMQFLTIRLRVRRFVRRCVRHSFLLRSMSFRLRQDFVGQAKEQVSNGGSFNEVGILNEIG
jgi:hypothetical protein